MEVLNKYVLPLACAAVAGACCWGAWLLVAAGSWMGAVCALGVAAGNGYFVYRDVKTKWLKK